ncbi:hypothetical protein [Bacteroides sp.]|uniref:hypothetical protein n=1 Tax=Bacteroides sp. TaxID=29523 RepID=UPI004025CB1C
MNMTGGTTFIKLFFCVDLWFVSCAGKAQEIYLSREWNVALDSLEIVYTRDLEGAKAALRLGKKVLLNPVSEAVFGPDGNFFPVFWSPLHFPE